MTHDPTIRAPLQVAALALCETQTQRRHKQPCVCKAESKPPCAGLLDYTAVGVATFLRALDRAAVAERMRERDCHPDDGWNQILALLVEDVVRHD